MSLALLQIAAGFAVEGDSGNEPLYSYVNAASSLVVYLLLICLSFGLVRLLGNVAVGAGLARPTHRWVSASVVVAVASVVLAAALEPALDAGEQQGLLPADWRPERAGAFAANALVVVAVGPFAEEVFYRGVGITVLRPATVPLAIVATALAWTFAHGLLVAVPALFAFGLALGWLRTRTASVWPAAVAHALYNAAGLSIVFV